VYVRQQNNLQEINRPCWSSHLKHTVKMCTGVDMVEAFSIFNIVCVYR